MWRIRLGWHKADGAILPPGLTPSLVARIRALRRVRGRLRLLDMELELAAQVPSDATGEIADVWHGTLPPAPWEVPEDRFDLVISLLTVSPAQDPGAVLGAIRRVIADDGLFVVLMRNARPWYDRLGGGVNAGGGGEGWSPGDFRTLLIRHGFRVGEHQAYGFLPLPRPLGALARRLAGWAHAAADWLGHRIDPDAGGTLLLVCRPGA